MTGFRLSLGTNKVAERQLGAFHLFEGRRQEAGEAESVPSLYKASSAPSCFSTKQPSSFSVLFFTGESESGEDGFSNESGCLSRFDSSVLW